MSLSIKFWIRMWPFERIIDSGLVDLSRRCAARAEDAEGTPDQSHISQSILGFEDYHLEPKA